MVEFASVVRENIKEVKVIIDAGSSNARDLLYLSAELISVKSPGCRAIAIEAREDVQALLPVEMVKVVLSNKDGWGDFHINPNHTEGSSIFKKPSVGYQSEKRETKRMDTLLKELGIDRVDVMKLDVEGASLPVLQGMGEYIKTLQALHVETELQNFWDDSPLEPDVFRYLSENGMKKVLYQMFENQSDSVWIRK